MAILAAEGLKIEDKNLIHLVIVATSTHSKSFPSVSSYVHKALSLSHSCTCFDISDACNGFVQAIILAHSLLRGTGYQALVIGADKMSSILDWSDRNTSILFGDGAGAMLIDSDKDDFKSTSYTMSEHIEELYANPKVYMNGSKVFKYAVNSMAQDIVDILTLNSLDQDQIRYFVPHQANSRIIEAIRERVKLSDDRIVNIIASYANTSAATIPFGLHSIFQKLEQGDLLLLSGFAAGFRGGSVLLRR
jgi:3-oxoacyl-[acyl-carrier-protein] synthase-3